MPTPLRLLILEDQAADAELMLHEVRQSGFVPDWRRVETEADYRAHLDPQLDLILADYSLPQFNALGALQLLQQTGLDVPFIVVTGTVSEEAAVECMKQGATDYILKDRLTRLGPAIKHALDERQLRAERRRAVEALRISEERLKTFLNAPTDMVFLKDGQYRHLFANQALADFFGKSPAEVVGLSDFDLMPPDGATACRRSDKLAQAEKQPILSEETVGGRYYEALKFVVPLGDGQEGIGGFIRNITERKLAEEAQRASEERFRLAAQSVSDVVWQWDIETHRLDWYGGIDSLLGFQPGQFPRTVEAWENVLHPGDKARVMAALESHFKAGRPYREEYRVFRKDGSIAHWRDTGTALKDERGKPYLMIGAVADVTKQIQAEEELRRSEALLNKAQQVSHVGSWVWHVPTNRLEFSNEMFRIFGIDRDKFVADIIRLVGQAIHADDRARVHRAILSAIKERTPIPLECRVLRPDGTIRVIRAEQGELILDNEGQPLVVTGIAQDITEQKQSEEALLESEARYRTLVENANDAIIVAQEGLLKFANRRTSEMTGYSHQEIVGKPFAGFIHPDDRQMVVNNYASRIRGEKVPKNYLFRVVGKSGKEVWAEINAVLIQWQGHPATLNFLSDITERKQAEERIQTLMREIEFVLGATKTTLDIIDPKFNLRFVDPASNKARDNWPGRKCYDYFMGRRSPCSNCGMSQALRTKDMVVSEVVLLQEGQRPVQIISIPFQDEKGEWLVAEVSVDITERKRAEKALLASREELRLLTARLQSLREEERTYLAREIHDELGQALTALNMDLAWLAGRLPKSQPQLLKKAEAMSAVVASTMQTVKRLSSELRPGLLDDLGLVAAMQWQAEEFGKRTWLKMKLVFQPEEMTVERDLSTAIFRIFQELLTNIARHAKATRVEVSLKHRAGAMELRVKDNGRGIKKSEIASSRSLGLIGVRERALAFGGRVEITGVPHKGTKVVVRLPERGRNDGKNSGG